MFENGTSGDVERVVAVAVVAALVNRHAVGVGRRPFTDTVALICSNTPVHPKVALIEVRNREGVVGHVNGDVVNQTGHDLL